MGPSYFDTHCHLDPDDDLAEILADAQALGVDHILVAGAAVEQAPGLPDRLQGYQHVYGAVGVHPHEAAIFNGDLAPFREWSALPFIRAIGEIGLDYFYDFSPREKQQAVFRSFLELAVSTGLPAIVHVRDAYEDTERILREVTRGEHPFVIHCFSAGVEWAERFLDLGAMLSFTGLLTFNKAQSVRDALRRVPLDRLMFETDAPYLAPVPHRGKRNRPAWVVHVVERAALELGMPVADLAAHTTANACRFFDVPLTD